MSYATVKPKIDLDEINILLEKIFPYPVEQIEEAPTGKIKKVYFLKYMGKAYVIRFSKDDKEFKFEKYLQEALKGEDFPLAKLLYNGSFNNYYYAISEKIEGVAINTLSEKEVKNTLPSIMEALTKLHSIDLAEATGYGWLDSNRDGTFDTFTGFLQSFFSREQEGFWKGWYDLFENSFLDYDIFKGLYKKMMELAPYCEGRRYLTHTDFHYNNLIINNLKLVGIIDWGGVSYLDFIFDLARLIMEFPDYNLLNEFQAFYKENNMDTSNFNQRFLCAALCHSLDGMRFWAKLGSIEAYKSILDNVLMILNKYEISRF
ncbi:phosphotransferase family protein [Clostridium cellulovorans]|uniref:Aminoglycoside phosphotransferase n=1 Tax=Clostridium cellulovorans (strain ATCC 35296 / DSM 3052 / OCM 3 / 743B) TaxID=573061 RepID=D9SUY6_CLOC7|nr:aminoglycoside phosphotransferase family protein [Clostridium cellulovorans]ADL52961.1 aminoglycoside phosphotransferase [Clostridium cellulovorans 743B]